MANLPPMDARTTHAINAVLVRAGDRAEDLAQEAWVAHLSGDNALRRVWRMDRAERRRQARERPSGTLDIGPEGVRKRY